MFLSQVALMAEILFFLRRNYLDAPGGDTVQMESWRKVITSLGHNVSLTCDHNDRSAFSSADAVFIWHLERIQDSCSGFLAAKKSGKKVFLVPTCWQRESRITPARMLSEDIKQRLRQIIRPTPGNWSLLFKLWYFCRRNMLKNSDLLLVNSNAERDMLVSQGADINRVTVIPNVIDEELANEVEIADFDKRSTSIHVGHFCPRKNQLGLIEALTSCSFDVTFAGKARPMHRSYWRKCRQIAGTRHDFPGALPRKKVLELMAKSRLSISTSIVETPGIANLEAAALGCMPVLPDIAPVREYFGDMAYYIDPENIEHNILEAAYQAVPDGRLRKRILDNYTEKNLFPIFQKLFAENL